MAKIWLTYAESVVTVVTTIAVTTHRHPLPIMRFFVWVTMPVTMMVTVFWTVSMVRIWLTYAE
jgi:hypothetical protein